MCTRSGIEILGFRIEDVDDFELDYSEVVMVGS